MAQYRFLNNSNQYRVKDEVSETELYPLVFNLHFLPLTAGAFFPWPGSGRDADTRLALLSRPGRLLLRGHPIAVEAVTGVGVTWTQRARKSEHYDENIGIF